MTDRPGVLSRASETLCPQMSNRVQARARMAPFGEELVDIKATASALGLSYKTIWRLTRLEDPALPFYRVGGRLRFRPSEIKAYIDSRKNEALSDSASSPVTVALASARGAQRLALARQIIDVAELAGLPEAERTVGRFERIRDAEATLVSEPGETHRFERGIAWHRNQFARLREWCDSIGIEIDKDSSDAGPDARIEINAKVALRILNKHVVKDAVDVRRDFEKRKKAKQ
jgi:predicted DNA-binding transcriptional regulator AlpA